ncbi:MAG: non-homologous end-joining DNA ligase [Polyangiaceae bacterium]|nr:non-homologous end-joining DNA ligase [Polyangiaceae bacterium]
MDSSDSPALRLAQELSAPVAEVDGRRIAPMLCAQDDSAARILAEPAYLFELKLDGVRIVADRRDHQVSLTYRKIRDATESYPEIAEAIAKLPEPRVVLDGEIIAFDEAGKPSFERLGQRIQLSGVAAKRAVAKVPVVYVVFDVLALGDRDLRALSIEARKEILERLLSSAPGANAAKDALVRLHPTFNDGRMLWSFCCEHGLEGVVAKRRGSVYRTGERAVDWVKIKRALDADFVIVGWVEGEGSRSRLGALDLAAYEDERLVLRGSVGSGLDDRTISTLLERLVAMEVGEAVAEGSYAKARRRHHARPEIVASVSFAGYSTKKLLRHPVFRGLRPDVDPRDCTAAPFTIRSST